MNNQPGTKLGIAAVSRDCFPVGLSRKRRDFVIEACKNRGIEVIPVPTIVENEKDVLHALVEIGTLSLNALVIFLGNFGPEGPATQLAQRFPGPVMFAAAAEESMQDLVQGRGDAYCGLLNTSYSLGLRRLRSHIPENPVGTAEEVARNIVDFIPVARMINGIKALKIFSFGPRPQDFYACNAPIRPLFDLGVEIMENSELDLYDLFRKAQNDPDIERVAEDMARELGSGNRHPGLLVKLARYEVALLKFMDENLGASRFGVFANKCWPAFEPSFGFVPCYVNSRLAARGIPVACEVDIYGALSEYLASCASGLPATLLDINNTVPNDLYEDARDKVKDYTLSDLFMGFHCGNTAASCMIEPEMKYQRIMHRLMEPEKEPDITRGTLEGRIRPGKITMFRLQSTADAQLRSYMAEGEVLDIEPHSFGSIGVFAIKEMGRFYRHVLIGRRFPHHMAVAFRHVGKSLFSALKMLGIEEVHSNRPAGHPYPEENPFA